MSRPTIIFDNNLFVLVEDVLLLIIVVMLKVRYGNRLNMGEMKEIIDEKEDMV